MPVFLLDERPVFPAPDLADEDGLLAVGGDLSEERLLLAYRSGIFPWYGEGEPILWFSPDPRMVLLAERLQVSQRLARTVRRGRFRVTLDTRFREVIDACATVPRPERAGTWITPELRRSFVGLHERGLAHSVEVWEEDALAGGLYGLSLGAAFFGESMFSRVPDASKVGFVVLVRQLAAWGIRLVDCQIPSAHLARFGAEEWSRPRFLAALRAALRVPTRPGPWSLG